MNDAKKLAMLLVGVMAIVAFINRGQLQLQSGPQGASLNAGFFGLIK